VHFILTKNNKILASKFQTPDYLVVSKAEIFHLII